MLLLFLSFPFRFKLVTRRSNVGDQLTIVSNWWKSSVLPLLRGFPCCLRVSSVSRPGTSSIFSYIITSNLHHHSMIIFTNLLEIFRPWNNLLLVSRVLLNIGRILTLKSPPLLRSPALRRISGNPKDMSTLAKAMPTRVPRLPDLTTSPILLSAICK